MKKIKKLITPFILIALCVCFVVPFAGCGGADDTPDLPDATKNGEWIEVQRITYWTNTGSYTTSGATIYDLVSTYSIEAEIEEVSKEEYDRATDEQKNSIPDYNITDVYMPINRKEIISTYSSLTGKTYFIYSSSSNSYFRLSLNFVLRYVRVRYLDNNCIEINYYETSKNQGYTSMRILPLSYSITYFND